jgi:tRNA-Thr(GGU) m(6)t(6)A37 methyltransferase TsaA
MPFTFEQIGVIHSCFKEKFGIPRQPGLVPQAKGTLELLPPYNRPEGVRGLEGFSHVWVTFVFHGCESGKWQPTVRPPRLGGNQRIGVFASRSTHRPNPIGLSVLELERIVADASGVVLHLKGVDLLDGTPVLDIKPYIPYADALPHASGGFAAEAPHAATSVQFAEGALQVCRDHPDGEVDLAELIRGLLQQDPRPAYFGEEQAGRVFGMRLLQYDVKWTIDNGTTLVTDILRV